MSLQRSEDAHEELLQERLRILLDRMRWSYASLWTLNPRTRMLEWKRGHFEVANAKAGATEYAQLFYTTYKSCCFTPGVGSVGRANLKGKHIWLTGDAVCQHAGSVEQSQFLRCAEIKTTICIPWVDSVLEIGSISVVAENLVLTDRIQQVLANDLLSVPVAPEPAGFEHASTQTGPGAAAGITMFPGFHRDLAAPCVDHPTNLALQPPTSIRQYPSPGIPLAGAPAGQISLAEPAWRSANNLSLSLSSDISEMQPNSHADMVKENLAYGQEAGASSSMHMQAQDNSGAPTERHEIINQSVNQSRGLMTDQYRSIWSGATVASSSTVSSLEGSCVSPELQQQIHANSSSNPRFSADDSLRTSTSRTLHSHSQLPGPQNLNHIRRTNSCGDQYEIQKYLTLCEAQEMHEQWRQRQHPVSELAANTDATVAKTMATEPTSLPAGQNFPFQGWQRDVGSPAAATLQIVNSNGPSKRPTVQRSNVKLMNQVSKIAGPLLRRQSLSALELLKDVDKYQKEAAEVSNVPYDVKPFQVLQELSRPAHVQINGPNPRGQRMTMEVELASSGDPVHAGHGEAAVSHMLAERRRRTKQKENFTALRRLVPIISKADKASTLTDTITYLKFLQNKIQELEAIKEDIDQQCEILENRCQGLRERNQELVEMISKDQPGSAIHLNLLHLKLQSMNSI